MNSETDNIKWDSSGLVAGVVQHAGTGEVRMVGYLSPESLALTMETGFVHFFSRSRQRLWKKGETSGNVLEVVDITTDCDGDVLLIRAIPHGPTCHTGAESCFFSEPIYRNIYASVSPSSGVVDEVAAVIATRKVEMPEGSYTSYLFSEGIDKISKKIGEESAEVIVAAKNGEPAPLAQEASDLIYHLLVMLSAMDVPVEDVWQVLSQRRGSVGQTGETDKQ